MASTSESNSLRLEFDTLSIKNPSDPPKDPDADASESATDGQSPKSPTQVEADVKEKKKPYVNPERVKTGGAQRDKLSEGELTERMARMREQNEKIKQRRMDVRADEEAFKKTQESERAKQAQSRKVQDNVNRTREQNARRKMDKIESREWDSEKSGGGWKKKPIATDGGWGTGSPATDGGWKRGGSQRGRGRGRGRGGAVEGVDDEPQSTATGVSSDWPPTASDWPPTAGDWPPAIDSTDLSTLDVDPNGKVDSTW